MHRNPAPPGKVPHPEADRNRRVGSKVFYGVRTEYGIQQEDVLLGGRVQSLPTVAGREGFAHWYAPFVHTELPGELAKLAAAGDDEILTFASTYGEMGFDFLADVEWQVNRLSAGQRMFVGDPLPWLRDHARGAYICLAITEAIAKKRARARLASLLQEWDGMAYGALAHSRHVLVDNVVRRPSNGRKHLAPTPEDVARAVRREIINQNIGGIHRYVSIDEKGHDRSYFRYTATIEVVYWHLANVIEGGIVKRCEGPGCGGMFIQTDPRQRFCPKRWRQRESSCATRQRQAKHRQQ